MENIANLISKLEEQKEKLGNGIFDQELLDKYLDASFLKQCNEAKEIETVPKETRMEVELSGLSTLELNTRLNRLNPYDTANPTFIRAFGNWDASVKNKPIIIKIPETKFKQRQKTKQVA